MIFEPTFDNDQIKCVVLWTDIALDILKKDRTLATKEDRYERTALQELARKPLAFDIRIQLSVWERIERCFNSCEFADNTIFFTCTNSNISLVVVFITLITSMTILLKSPWNEKINK
jgi:hypothetical protein